MVTGFYDSRCNMTNGLLLQTPCLMTSFLALATMCCIISWLAAISTVGARAFFEAACDIDASHPLGPDATLAHQRWGCRDLVFSRGASGVLMEASSSLVNSANAELLGA